MCSSQQNSNLINAILALSKCYRLIRNRTMHVKEVILCIKSNSIRTSFAFEKGVDMTYLQLYRDQLRENERSNRAQEAENLRHNRIYEQETRRHNEQTEDVAYKQYLENQRQSLVGESIRVAELDEKTRAAKANEMQKAAELAETRAYHKAVVAEQVRANTAEEEEKIRNHRVLEAQNEYANRTERTGTIWRNVNESFQNFLRTGDLIMKVVTGSTEVQQ